MSSTLSETERVQQEHYEKISEIYEYHYDDQESARFREAFLYRKLFENIDLNQTKVLDAMCGAGSTSSYLSRFPCEIFGLDLSSKLIGAYRQRNPSCRGTVGSIFSTPFSEASFDHVVIIGGLHHLHPHLEKAMKEIDRILKPGGSFLFMEPPAGTVTDLFRKLWYSMDPLFEKNEKSVDIDRLLKNYSNHFEVLSVRYGGGPGYFFILNSGVFRLPKWIKTLFAKPLMGIDRVLERFLPKVLSSYAVVQLRKK